MTEHNGLAGSPILVIDLGAIFRGDGTHAWEPLDDFYKNGLGYALEMNNRAPTLYGIADSPVGLAAWMIDHDIRSYRMIVDTRQGKRTATSAETCASFTTATMRPAARQC